MGLLAEGMVDLALAAGQNLAVLVGAALVGDGAAGLAGALAGTLALAAAAVGQGLTQAGLGDGLDMLHDGYPSNAKFHYAPFIIQLPCTLFLTVHHRHPSLWILQAGYTLCILPVSVSVYTISWLLNIEDLMKNPGKNQQVHGTLDRMDKTAQNKCKSVFERNRENNP